MLIGVTALLPTFRTMANTRKEMVVPFFALVYLPPTDMPRTPSFVVRKLPMTLWPPFTSALVIHMSQIQRIDLDLTLRPMPSDSVT